MTYLKEKEDSEKRCLIDTFNGKEPLCKNWDCFFESCKLLWYNKGKDEEGKSTVIHPKITFERRWLISRVGCACFEARGGRQCQIKDLDRGSSPSADALYSAVVNV